jgi:soluble lytic murein transglycosylase-like protein
MCALQKLVLGLACLALTASALGSDFAVLQNGFSIRHERRQVVGAVTRLYLSADGSGYVDVPTSEIDRFEKDLAPAASAATPEDPQRLDQAINSSSARYHIDPDLIHSVIQAESGFHPFAISRKGAQGLMQLMPQTASRLGVANTFDPQANVEGGTRYLRELLERYDFNLIKALAAYNAGPRRVEQYRGVPPFHETRAYVARVVRDFNRKKLAERETSVAKTSSNSRRPAASSGTAVSRLQPEASR